MNSKADKNVKKKTVKAELLKHYVLSLKKLLEKIGRIEMECNSENRSDVCPFRR